MYKTDDIGAASLLLIKCIEEHTLFQHCKMIMLKISRISVVYLHAQIHTYIVMLCLKFDVWRDIWK